MSSQTPKKSAKGTLQLKEISIIPITNNLQISSSCVNEKIASKSSSSSIQLKKQPPLSEDDVDLLSKKRCNDRCDSSESSDSGVITMSVDSQATSDSSDPGSPFSHSSSTHTEELTSQSKGKQPPKAQKRQSNLIDKNNDKKRVRKDLCTANKNNLEIKLVPITNNTQTATAEQQQQQAIGQQQQQQRKTSNNNLQIANFLTTKQQQPQLITFNSTPALAPNINKMTDYYKLKKEVSNLINIDSNKQQQLQTIKANNLINKSSSQTKVGSTGSVSSVVSVTQMMDSPSRPLDTLMKKSITYEKKTAKIAPVIPVARKSAVCNIKPTKKPVSIAPRLEPKSNVVKKLENSHQQQIETNKAKESVTLPSKPMQNMNNNQNSGPTVLLAAIRIPPQPQNSSQPPPLGLIQKTTTTTTTTTKLGPLIQLHHAPHIIQIPNLVSSNKTPNLSSKAQISQANQSIQNGNVYGTNNSSEPTAHQMLSAVIKLQTPSNNSNASQQQQKQQNSFAAQLASHQVQQLFMAPQVLFNASSLPVLAHHHHHHNPFGQISTSIPSTTGMPALQPIQMSSYAASSMTQTTQSLHLPSLNALIQSQNSASQQFQSLQNFSPQQQCFQTLLKSSAISMPPSLALSSSFVQSQQQRINANHHHQLLTKLSNTKSVPPLAPASNFPIQLTKNIQKVISVKSSSCQTSPKTKSPPPLVMNQKVSLPKSSPVAAQINSNLKQEICVVPPLPSPAKVVGILKKEQEEEEEEEEPKKEDIKSSISIFVEEKISTESAKSPILSQPKTIRFPPVNGKVTVWKKCVKISQKGVCNWAKCCKQFDSNSDLLDHLNQHIISQEGPFICSWRDCKVNGREGSRGWLERHIISHVGSTKPFKCIVERCGMRFGSQLQLEKHVNGHFNGSDQQNEKKRSSDPFLLKKVKKDMKKCKPRRQPWSARRFDFFDAGMVEILKHRLEKDDMTFKGKDMEVSFKGQIVGKRQSMNGEEEFKVTWKPENIFDDEWMKKPENMNKFKLSRKVSLKSLTPAQRCAITSHFENLNSRMNGCGVKKLSRKYKPKVALSST